MKEKRNKYKEEMQGHKVLHTIRQLRLEWLLAYVLVRVEYEDFMNSNFHN